MNVHVSAETAKKLHDLATNSGRAPEDIVEDALAGYLEEVASVRKTLDTRYDDLGLKLRPARGPVEVLVIDSVQQPTPN